MQNVVDEECFICCSSDGKNEHDHITDQYFNRKTFGYPIVLLSDVYECRCNSYAHNKCLYNVNKCPMCRKSNLNYKSNLVVKSRLDLYLNPLFTILKSNPKFIKWIKMVGCSMIILMVVIIIGIDKGVISLPTNPDYKFHITIVFALSIQFIGGIVLTLEDYFKKYWLYNERIGTIGII